MRFTGSKMYAFLFAPALLGGRMYSFLLAPAFLWGTECMHFYLLQRSCEQNVCIFTCSGAPGGQNVCILNCSGAPEV